MHFDERAGVIECATEWGSWHQTIDDVVVLVDVPEGTTGKDVKVHIQSKKLSVSCKNGIVFEGPLYGTVVADESVWTIEDKKRIRIELVKSIRTPDATWPELLKDRYKANVQDLDNMERKATLERFARENPGFDFSNAEISGNYRGGGPKMPSFK